MSQDLIVQKQNGVRPSETTTEWQILALDTLARLTKQFALCPDCVKLVDLVLLSMTGQLSSIGAFACFKSNLGTEEGNIWRGSGVLHRHDQLAKLLETEDRRAFFLNQESPVTAGAIAQDHAFSSDIKTILAEARVSVVVPMVIGDSLLGILGLAPKVDNTDYSDGDLSLLVTLSNTISPLISNSLLYTDLKRLNLWHSEVLNSVRQGVVVLTGDLTLKKVNAQAEFVFQKLTGHSPRNAEVTEASDLFDAKSFPGWIKFIERSASRKDSEAVETLVARDEEGDRIFLVRVSRTTGTDSDEADVIVTFDDVTEQRNNERHMFEMEKFAEKGVMAASISHELNNHLALILGGLELAEMAHGRSDVDKVGDLLRRLKTHSNAMERFTAGLTDYSRLNSELSEQNLNRIISDVVSFARVQKRFKGTNVIKSLSTEDLLVNADGDQLAELLINLLNNSADAIRDAKRTDGKIEIVSSRGPNKVILQVKDNGGGIPPELREKLFITRFTTKDDGHGFGMVTCGRILKHHNATHLIDSTMGHGTTIVIEFPTP